MLLYQPVALTHDIEGFLVYFMPNYLRWTAKEITNHAATIRREFREAKQTSHFFSWTCTRKAWRQTLWQQHIDDGGTADNLTGFLRSEGVEVGHGHDIERVTVDLDRLVHRARRREEALREEESESESGEE